MKRITALILALTVTFCLGLNVFAAVTISDVGGIGSNRVELYYQGEANNPVGSYFDGTVDLFFEQSGSAVTVKAIPADSSKAFNLIIAVYDAGGAMVSFGVSDDFVGSGELTLDVSAYPSSAYSYKAFCWDKNYAPLFGAEAIAAPTIE